MNASSCSPFKANQGKSNGSLKAIQRRKLTRVCKEHYGFLLDFSFWLFLYFQEKAYISGNHNAVFYEEIKHLISFFICLSGKTWLNLSCMFSYRKDLQLGLLIASLGISCPQRTLQKVLVTTSVSPLLWVVNSLASIVLML